MVVIGWDVGGAHLKGARIEEGRVTAAVEIACTLWQGLDRLDVAFAEARYALGDSDRHAITMTGELSDIFPSRAEGVARLSEAVEATLPGRKHFYAGAAGWLDAAGAAAAPARVASANWHATASLAARHRPDALFADMGSTTTDLVPIVGGKVAARGISDAERAAAGELVYTGASRTSLMAVADRAPFRGSLAPLMNEYFASIADVHRILGDLPEDADRHPAADGRAKTFDASCARLARMLGRDVADGEAWEWRNVAAFFAEAQLHDVHRAALQVLSAARLPAAAAVVGAGSGIFVAERLAARLGRPFERWADLVPARPEVGAMAGVCAPAVAVGLLLAAQGAPP